MDRKLWLSTALALIGASLLVAAATAAPSKQNGGASAAAGKAKKGGTFIWELPTDVDYTDPQLSYYVPSWQLEYATACKLFNWPDKEGAAGGELTPEVAAGLPVISKDGRTYTFTIKPTFKFSQTGQVVTAQSFKSAIDRLANPKMASQGAPFLDVVAGAQAMIDGKASTVSGVVAKGNKLTITTTKPSPDLLARLTMPFFQAIDPKLASTIDPNGADTYNSCGPYYFAARTVNRSITLKRNTFYKGTRPANVDGIQLNIGNSTEVIYQNTLQNKTDYGAAPPSEYANVGQKFGVNKGRFQTRPEQGSWYVAFNHDRPLFKNNPQLAKALNWIIDRQAFTAQAGKYVGKRADQILPPGMLGFKDFSMYPLKITPGAIATGKKLAAGHTGDGKAVIWTFNRAAGPLWGQIIQYDVKQIGINAELKLLPRAQQFGTAKIRDQATYDIDIEGWGADYSDPYDFINILLDGSQIGPTGNNNYAYWNNPTFNKRMQQAQLLVGGARGSAYAKLDHDIMAQDPPWAPMYYINDRVLLSDRVGCLIINEVMGGGPDFVTACLK
jgi:ABC-type oligopeptide transport system substrate-binding subunit